MVESVSGLLSYVLVPYAPDVLFLAHVYATMDIFLIKISQREKYVCLIRKAWYAAGTITDICTAQNAAKGHTAGLVKEKAAKR